MPDTNELRKQLIELPERDYSHLIKDVNAERRHALQAEEKTRPVHSGMSRDEFAKWISDRHFAIDKGISRILYLPNGAPAEEVRLIEANDQAAIPENAPVAPVDFMPDIEGMNYSLFVADVTPRQLDAILQGELGLPKGWTIEGCQEFVPGAK